MAMIGPDVSMAIIEMIIDRTAIIRWQVSSFADIPIARQPFAGHSRERRLAPHGLVQPVYSPLLLSGLFRNLLASGFGDKRLYVRFQSEGLCASLPYS